MLKRIASVILVLACILGIFCTAYGDDINCGFTAYFLDVGEGDAIVIECDDYCMMIDGGPPDKSQYIYSFLKNHNIGRIDYMIATHPDADHVGGLASALNYADAGIIMCTVKEHDTAQFKDFKKYAEKSGAQIIVPNAGDRFSLGNASVEILSPGRGETYSDNTSIVLKVKYGTTTFLFMGDSEAEDEEFLLEFGADLKTDVLKVGHHGSLSSSTEEFIKKTDADIAIISVGADNSYGHPAEEVIKRLEKINADIYRTDECGIITVLSDGKTISVQSEKEKRSDGNTTEFKVTEDIGGNSIADKGLTESGNQITSAEKEKETANNIQKTSYIANTNSHKFHYPSCKSVNSMKESNKWYFTGTRDELINQGYIPCKNCNP